MPMIIFIRPADYPIDLQNSSAKQARLRFAAASPFVSAPRERRQPGHYAGLRLIFAHRYNASLSSTVNPP